MTGFGDHIGQRGENLFRHLITFTDHRPSPWFNPTFLGEKYPGIGVTLTGTGLTTPFFFAQIKTTQQGYRNDGRLRIKRLSENDLLRAAGYPGPTYVFGIDEPGECGYILAVDREGPSPVNGFPTTYPVNAENRPRLWEEVKRYWSRPRRLRSIFTDPERFE